MAEEVFDLAQYDEKISKLRDFRQDYAEFPEKKRSDTIENPLKYLSDEGKNIIVDNKEEMKNQPKKDDKTPQAIKKVSGGLGGLGKKVKDWKAPTGISMILAIIIFILLAVKPTESGKTRLQLFFQSILGQTKLEGVTISSAKLSKEDLQGDVEYMENYIKDTYGDDAFDEIQKATSVTSMWGF